MLFNPNLDRGGLKEEDELFFKNKVENQTFDSKFYLASYVLFDHSSGC